MDKMNQRHLKLCLSLLKSTFIFMERISSIPIILTVNDDAVSYMVFPVNNGPNGAKQNDCWLRADWSGTFK